MLEGWLPGTHIIVHYKDVKDHARQFGYFQTETEESVTIEGTIGNWIGKPIIIPKSNIIFIEVARETDAS